MDSPPYIINPAGDTVLIVGPSPSLRLLVSSETLEQSSPIFAALVAEGRMRRIPGYRIEIPLEFDSTFAMRALCIILHRMEPYFPFDWDVDALWELTQVAHKYRCTHLIRDHVERLYPIFAHVITSGYDKDDGETDPGDRYEEQVKLVAISLAIDSQIIFCLATKVMIEEYAAPFDDVPDLDWSIINSNVFSAIMLFSEDYCDALFDGLSDIQTSILDSSESTDMEGSCCRRSLLASFQSALEANSLVPRQAISVIDLRKAIQECRRGLGETCQSPCSTCDAFKRVQQKLEKLVESVIVTGLYLKDWKGDTSPTGTVHDSSSEDENEDLGSDTE